MKTNQSVEQIVKRQFARIFAAGDEALFKSMAEFYLRTAALLKSTDVAIVPELRLLARNCQKRLYIGIGTELVLKAIYLKRGFLINKLDRGQVNAPAFPFTKEQAKDFKILNDQTYMLDDLIAKLKSVLPLTGLNQVQRGLKIAKVFRNKEGHGVLPRHIFDPSNYRDIEASLVTLYAEGFGETLRVRFSVAKGEVGLWRIKQSWHPIRSTSSADQKYQA